MATLEYWSETLKERLDESTLSHSNEVELRLHVEHIISDALRDLYGFDLTQIKSERTNAAGKYDTRYGGIVTEYEWAMHTAGARRRAAQQALDYLQAERLNLPDQTVMSAVVCDGLEWGFLVLDPADDDVFTPPLNPQDRFAWYRNSVAVCRRFLQLVGAHPKIPVSGTALVEAFGGSSQRARRLITIFLEVLRNRSRNDKADTMYREWRRSMDVAYGDLDAKTSDIARAVREGYQLRAQAMAGELVFSIHSYFALLSRLIAVEALAIAGGEEKSRPSTWGALDEAELIARCTDLENGDLPSGLDITNLLEGDVFSWYLPSLWGNNSLQDAFRDICTGLGNFAFPNSAFGIGPGVDLLRDLYKGLTPRLLRKALGEFPTPHWLAEATLELASICGADIQNGRVLDPTCGTGTFLQPILTSRLRRLRSKTGSNATPLDVQNILDSVVGIDINPIAVIASRMNYLIALGDLASVGGLHLPIWLADSVLLPAPPDNQMTLDPSSQAKYLELMTSLDDPFPIPEEFVSQQSLVRLARALRTGIESGIDVDEFLREMDLTMGPNSSGPIISDISKWQDCASVLRVLYGRLIDLDKAGRDHIWPQIIENRFAPLLLPKFDVVVGNPPGSLGLTYQPTGEVRRKTFGRPMTCGNLQRSQECGHHTGFKLQTLHHW